MPPHPDHRWELEYGPAAAARARDLARKTLANWGLTELCDDVTLAVSELVANAILHGRPPVTLAMWREPYGCGIVVVDHGGGFPRLRDLRLDEHAGESGRGMALVNEIADDFGACRRSAICRVWATFHRAP
ncbi:ATP-binding protein [Thermopolyspora sp. NPDC052614]|uniref:ATP-binding protein n=1 Tax=Thermopolyspora sp. NPDC052614 TaxID=3155682 RepID=UPI003431A502